MRALITGVTGQTGSYLAELLAGDGYEVHGLIRGASHPKREWLTSLVSGIVLHEGDLLDQSSLIAAVEESDPDEVYNLGAVTFVGSSWRQAQLVSEVTGLGVLRMLEAVRIAKPSAHFVQASSSEMFGSAPPLQSEQTTLAPRSPYAAAKAFGHHMVSVYRESYGMHASSAIAFNHESPRRGDEFVTQRVARAVRRIANGEQSTLTLGNLQARRDWGWAPDYARAYYLMARQDRPDDYVLATGEAHSVGELVEAAFDSAGLDWRGRVITSPDRFRPAEVEALCGDATKARDRLGWEPTLTFSEIVRQMVASV